MSARPALTRSITLCRLLQMLSRTLKKLSHLSKKIHDMWLELTKSHEKDSAMICSRCAAKFLRSNLRGLIPRIRCSTLFSLLNFTAMVPSKRDATSQTGCLKAF